VFNPFIPPGSQYVAQLAGDISGAILFILVGLLFAHLILGVIEDAFRK
jgi:hypothetical protein